MTDLRVELFYSLSDPASLTVRERVRAMSAKYGIDVRETLAPVRRIRSWRRRVKAVPTIQVERRTVWVGSIPDDVLERIFRELAGLGPLESENGDNDDRVEGDPVSDN